MLCKCQSIRALCLFSHFEFVLFLGFRLQECYVCSTMPHFIGFLQFSSIWHLVLIEYLFLQFVTRCRSCLWKSILLFNSTAFVNFYHCFLFSRTTFISTGITTHRSQTQIKRSVKLFVFAFWSLLCIFAKCMFQCCWSLSLLVKFSFLFRLCIGFLFSMEKKDGLAFTKRVKYGQISIRFVLHLMLFVDLFVKMHNFAQQKPNALYRLFWQLVHGKHIVNAHEMWTEMKTSKMTS